MTGKPLLGPAHVPQLHVMTLNVRHPTPHLRRNHPDRWKLREPAVSALLRLERPTVLGLQEALPMQLAAVESALGNGYRRIGTGRRNGRVGEHCAICFDETRLELLDWRQEALSDTPDISGSIGWGNWIPRILVSALFRDRSTGHRFMVFNTHLDHLSAKSRIRSAEAIVDMLPKDVPAFVTGDFNAGHRSRVHRAFTGGGTVLDSWNVAEQRLTEPWGTFLSYRPPKNNGRRIDWILTTPSITVRQVAVNTGKYDGGWPSDHAPVQLMGELE
ncbi:MAG TPA: endonuclease/exonuclease/phosphatase family protein [Arthrobacter sp.]|nr:endonuclease/exonuclease/phosphatase family protein [Arthrobacter sp.]